MKKVNKKVSSRNYRSYVEMPDIVSIDVLNYAGDDELEYRMSQLTGDRDKALQADMDPRPWEEELAYVQREMRIRVSRRLAHDKYVRSNPESHANYDNAEVDVNLN